MEKSKGRIVDIRRDDQQYGAIVQGEQARHCVDGRGYTGGNGTFLVWACSGVDHYLMLDVAVYAENNHKRSIDIRSRVLALNKRSRVTDKLIKILKIKNVGRKINLFRGENTNWQWKISNWSEIDLKV